MVEPTQHVLLGMLVLLLSAIAFSGVIYAQVERGTIAGTVHDPSGAVIPDTDIVVKNVNTGVEYKTSTNQAGEYVAPNLIPGQYSVIATGSGFSTLVRTGITLHVNDRLSVDLILQVGEVTQRVEVTGEAPLLKSETSSVGMLVSRRDVSDLPLNGRSVFQLASLAPGVTNGRPGAWGNRANIPANARAQQGLSANGHSETANTYILDGVYNNQVAQGMIAILPPLEAIQEFEIETSNFLPEIGRGGAVMNVTLKSGTNSLHGQIFNFHRNAALDARNFFDRRTAQFPRRLPNFVRNQFGFALGGPIRKDKIFFFGDYQGLRDRQGQSFVTTVPGPAIRRGDFRGTARPIFDPATYNAATNSRQRFPTDMVIDPSRFNSAAAAILEFIPLPNDPNGTILANGEGLYFSGPSRRNDQGSFDIKVDHHVSNRHSITGRFSFGDSRAVLPGSFADDPKFAPAVGQGVSTTAAPLTGNVNNPARSIAFQWIYNINPAMMNEFRSAYIRSGSRSTQLNFGKKFADQLGIPNANVTESNSGFPGILIGGLSGFGDTSFFPLIQFENTYQLLNNTTLVHGSHTLKWGVDFKKVGQNTNQILGFPAGSFNFGTGFTSDPAAPAATGNSFADFLLGIPSGGDLRRNGGTFGLRWTELSGYWQDIWKASQRLTVNYGVRYDLFTAPTEVRNRMTNFDLLTGKLILPGQGGSLPGYETDSLAQTDKNNFAPRLGFAYKLNDNSVLRGAYGIFYIAESKTVLPLAQNPPFVGGVTYFNTAVPQQISRTLDQGLPVTDPFIPIDQFTGTIEALEPDHRTGYTQQWSLGTQRQLSPNIFWDVTYVGNSSSHLLDINLPNQPFLGTGPVTARQPYFPLVGRNFTLRLKEQRGRGNYHALQSSLTRRFSQGLSFLTNYTWSHAIENRNDLFSSHQDARNLDADRGNSGNDVRHRFVFSGLYQLPFNHSNASAVAKAIMGGWQFGGVAVVQSGSPFTVTGGAGRPNRICDGHMPNPTPDRWFDASCFPLPAAVPDPVRGGLFIPFGNSGTNILTGPGAFNVDLSIFKTVNLREGSRVEFRTEVFNVFNHSQFFNPVSAVNTGLTTRVVNARQSRQIQLVLKFIF